MDGCPLLCCHMSAMAPHIIGNSKELINVLSLTSNTTSKLALLDPREENPRLPVISPHKHKGSLVQNDVIMLSNQDVSWITSAFEAPVSSQVSSNNILVLVYPTRSHSSEWCCARETLLENIGRYSTPICNCYSMRYNYTSTP